MDNALQGVDRPDWQGQATCTASGSGPTVGQSRALPWEMSPGQAGSSGWSCRLPSGRTLGGSTVHRLFHGDGHGRPQPQGPTGCPLHSPQGLAPGGGVCTGVEASESGHGEACPGPGGGSSEGLRGYFQICHHWLPASQPVPIPATPPSPAWFSSFSALPCSDSFSTALRLHCRQTLGPSPSLLPASLLPVPPDHPFQRRWPGSVCLQPPLSPDLSLSLKPLCILLSLSLSSAPNQLFIWPVSLLCALCPPVHPLAWPFPHWPGYTPHPPAASVLAHCISTCLLFLSIPQTRYPGLTLSSSS